MTTLAAGESKTIVLRDTGQCTVTTNGGFADVVETVAGASTTHQFGPRPMRMTFGPYSEGGTVVITNASAVLDYDSPLGNLVTLSDDGTSLVDGAGIPLSYAQVLGRQHTAQSKSDLDAVESAALYTLDIPANTLGPNSSLRIRTLWTTPTSAAAKRLRGRFGGVVLWNLDLTTHVSYPLEFILSNRNSLASQIAQANNLSWAVALASSAVQTFTVDFATAQQFTITAQWPVAGAGSNNITLESVLVEHLYGA